MTGQEYDERRRALEEQLRADISLLNAAHAARIRALDRLRQEAPDGERSAAGTEPPRATVQPAPPPDPKPMRPRYSVAEDLAKVLPQLPRIFQRQDILRALGYDPCAATISPVHWRQLLLCNLAKFWRWLVPRQRSTIPALRDGRSRERGQGCTSEEVDG